ncbi:MAG: YihY/virulence factor BrkB family protein [Thermodesulfobacteriota bacterium]
MMVRTFLRALINDIGPLKNIRPCLVKRNFLMRKLKQKLSTHRNERFRFKCREVWGIFWEARRAFLLDGCLNLSAALAFYAIFSLIPFLFLLISATAYILGSSESGLMTTLSFLSPVLPHASSLIFEEAKAISQSAEVTWLVGFLSLLWTASAIFSPLEFAMKVVFRVEQNRSFLKGRLLALSTVPASALVLLLSFSVTATSGFLQEMEIIFWGIDLAKWAFLGFLIGYLFPYLILTLGFTAIYKIIPNTRVSFYQALAGGAICAFLFEVANHFFAWYIKNYGGYGMTYGALEAMIMLVLWTFYSACIMLFCAEMVSAYRRRDVTLLAQAFI